MKAFALAAVALATVACSSTSAAPSPTTRPTPTSMTTTAEPDATTTATPRPARDIDYGAALQPVIRSLPANSCVVVTLEGVTLVDHHGALALIPASAQKLLVGAAALEVLDTTQTGPVGEMLRNSDKDAAERLIAAIGGLPALRKWVGETGLDTAGVVINDGTGFDRGNRLSCRFLASLLDRAGATSALAGALPVAGQTGTLASRMRGTPAVGLVRAKTGTLLGVSALAGFATAGDGSALTFAIIVNAPRADTNADPLWSAFATALVTA